MYRVIRQLSVAGLLLALATTARAADSFKVDPVHSSVSFMISHAGISYIHGRFNDFSGTFVIDKDDPSKSSFTFSVKVDSVDTNNPKRDEHLRAYDYFDAKQFPTMSFKSTSVKPVEGGYQVAGDFTLHGVTKPITLNLEGSSKTVEFPKGTPRVGFVTSPVIKRSEFGMTAGLPSVGDDVHITIGVEAAKEK
ncbi:MAG TPA: YceI family protein [Pirellulales bacterium]|jgi:polyisoprenoid-binding protein YceI|nr:YceI family protein [Pirellulales bacterium]